MEDFKELAEGRSPSGLLLGSKEGKLEGDQAEGTLGTPMSTAKKTTMGGQVKEIIEGQGTASCEDGHANRCIGGKKPKPLVEDCKAGVAATEQSGYIAKRNEFDPEYDNDAELQLADMEFKDNDTETDRELKLRILHIYLSRLDDRKRRKDFIIERGLINLKNQAALDRKRTKEERELYQRTRVFLRFHSNEEHEALLAGLNAERRIRQRIEELQEMRSAGCHTLAEGEIYFLEKRKRETEVIMKKARESIPSLQGVKANHRSNRYMKREMGEGEPSPSGEMRSNQKPRSTSHHSIVNSVHKSAPKSVKKLGVIAELAGCPGMELLSATEQELCHQCKLLPNHYLKMKEVLMMESMRRGLVKRSDAFGMFKVEPIKTDRVYDLLMGMGWIQGDDLERKFNFS